MSISIDVFNPLHGEIEAYLCVDPATFEIKEIAQNRTVTVSPAVRLPNSATNPSTTAPFGLSFRTMGESYWPEGIQVDPPIPTSLTDNLSVMLIYNQFNSRAGSGEFGGLWSFLEGGKPQFYGASAALDIDAGAHAVLATRAPGDSLSVTRMYADGGAAVVTPDHAGIDYPNVTANFFGGNSGQSSVSLDAVAIIVFKAGKLVSQTEFAAACAELAAGRLPYVVSSGGADTTAPTMTGALTASNITTTGYTLSWLAGSDNTAVAGYEVSLDGGTTYTDAGNVLTKAITGRTAGATDQVRVRAYDAAGNKSSPLSKAITLLSGVAATVTTSPLINKAHVVQTNRTGLVTHFFRSSDGLLALADKTGQTSNDSGVMAVADAGLTAGQDYFMVQIDPVTKEKGISGPYTAI